MKNEANRVRFALMSDDAMNRRRKRNEGEGTGEVEYGICVSIATSPAYEAIMNRHKEIHDERFTR
jgi:hypothetical protein